MGDDQVADSNKPQANIRDDHGPIVAFLWWFSRILTIISVTFLWLRISRVGSFREAAFDARWRKSRPWWQDLGLGWWLLLGFLAWALAQEPSDDAVRIGGIIAIYLIIDMVPYFSRVLWFDGLRPAIPNTGTQVWSNRRLLVVAVLSFSWSIILFSVIYRAFGAVSSTASNDFIQLSFKTATTLDLSDSFGAVSNAQIVISLFFVAVVIATITSISYKRNEIASDN